MVAFRRVACFAFILASIAWTAHAQVPVPITVDPTITADAPLSFRDFHVPTPSISALASKLDTESLIQLHQASAPNAALINGQYFAAQNKWPLALGLLSVAIQRRSNNIDLRIQRMETAIQGGEPTLAASDALFILKSTDESQPPEPLAVLTLMVILAREEKWDLLSRLELPEFEEPLLHFIAQGVQSLAKMDQLSDNDLLLLVDKAFDADGFEPQKQFMLGLILNYMDRHEDGFPGFTYAIDNSELGVQRPSIWAYRSALEFGDTQTADSIADSIREVTNLSYQMTEILNIEFNHPFDKPTQREIIVEFLLQLSWVFLEQDNPNIANTLNSLAWLVDRGDLRVSSQTTIQRLNLNRQEQTPNAARYIVKEFGNDTAVQRLKLIELISTLISTGKMETALTELKHSEILGLDKTLIHRLRGNVLTVLDKYDDAILSFEAWEASRDPNTSLRADWIVYFQWGGALFQIGDIVGMEEKISKALELSPSNAFASNFLAYSWADKGIRLEEALEMLLAANETLPGRASILDSIGWTYFQLGKLDQALEYIEYAWSLESSSWEICSHLADVYFSQGRKNEAKWFWLRAVNFDDTPSTRVEAINKKLEDL